MIGTQSRNRAGHSSGYSAEELLRQRFRLDDLAETEQVRRLLEAAPWRVAERRTRRLRSARSVTSISGAARARNRSAASWCSLFRRKPRMRRRPIVLVCDVSGSMERYFRGC